MSPKPWYRHRWTWFLMLGPMIAMIACAITIRLAFDHADQQIISKHAIRGLVVDIDSSHAAHGK